MKIFYSWQSDLPNNNNRNFIQSCIDGVVSKYKNTMKIDADRDTQNETGSPDITNTIFEKIDECDLFVADISIINKSKYKLFRSRKKALPNPNVLIELGYAACKLGWERIVCVYNTDYSPLEALPFDLRQHRITNYSLFRQNKKEERKKIIGAISKTIDGLIESGSAIRPKGSNSLHQLLGFDYTTEKTSSNIVASPIPFSSLRANLVDMATKAVEKLNSSEIDFTGTKESFFGGLTLDLDSPSVVVIKDEEADEVSGAVEKLLEVEIKPSAFKFGNLKEKQNYLGGGLNYKGTDVEVQKHEDYVLLKRLLTEIVILDMFSEPFKDMLLVPLAIKNISQYLDRNINLVLTVEGDDFEIISPSKELLNTELKGNAGYVCEFGFAVELFSLKETHEIKYEDAEGYDYLNESSYLNLWDSGTVRDTDDCLDVLNDYIATPSSSNVLEFKINSLQANETKWLEKIVLIKIKHGNIKINYSIKSDNTDGSLSGVIEQ